MRYEDRVVDEVQALNDIVEVISEYIPLKRSGRTFKTLCPFHQEKTPSFIVHPEKQIFHCFGCSTGGNVFSFLMKYENLTFPEALRHLARRVNFPLPEPTRKDSREVSGSEELYEVYRLAQEYYSTNLKHAEKGRPARDYLQKRGFREEVLETFPLGWATPEWRGLFEFLVRKGIRQEAIYRSGLVQRSKEGHPYDLFRARLLFPIFNLQGRVIAFGGRTLGDDLPKYINSPESAIFRKRRELFGLNWAKRFLSQGGDRILIVEGYFDFLRVYLSGFRNVVATCGTALTEDHVRLLKRYVQEGVVIYDGDRAGEAASFRGLDIFLEEEMTVKVAPLPAGVDPDTFLEAKGAEEFRKLIEAALDFFDFKWQFLRRRYNPSDPSGLLKISNEFLETLLKIKDPLLLDRYLKKLAGLLGVEEEAIRAKLAFLTRKASSRGTENFSRHPSSFFSAPLEEFTLLALFLEDPELWRKMENTLTIEDFGHAGVRNALREFKALTASEAAVIPAQLLNHIEDETIQSFITAHSLQDLSPKEKEKAVRDCVRKIKRRRIDEKLERLRRAIRDAEGMGEGGKVTELLCEYRYLLTKRAG